MPRSSVILKLIDLQARIQSQHPGKGMEKLSKFYISETQYVTTDAVLYTSGVPYLITYPPVFLLHIFIPPIVYTQWSSLRFTVVYTFRFAFVGDTVTSMKLITMQLHESEK